jgi:hypothetical protein
MSIEHPGVEPDEHAAATTPRLGIAATALAAVLAVIVAIAVGTAAEGDHATGTVLAWVAIVGTAMTFALGIAAIVLRRGRRWGAVAVILSLLVNPWILMQILSFFSTLTAG